MEIVIFPFLLFKEKSFDHYIDLFWDCNTKPHIRINTAMKILFFLTILVLGMLLIFEANLVTLS